MKRILILTVVGCLTLGGWAFAQQQELLDHASNVNMQNMDDGSCSSSSSSGGQ